MILVLHGPNLNLLGKREKSIYGNITLEEINNTLISMGKSENIEVKCFQSNHEGELVDLIHKEGGQAVILVINPGAYTHTSIAIRDAILGTNIAAIEVHMSNIYKREKFRHHSYLKDICIGQIAGFGAESYYLAMQAAINNVKSGGNR